MELSQDEPEDPSECRLLWLGQQADWRAKRHATTTSVNWSPERHSGPERSRCQGVGGSVELSQDEPEDPSECRLLWLGQQADWRAPV